ncbi:MAG: tripartite tricarboxylate transporter substrate binding protein, partial [Pseudomonadota bacterium]|nr:tripartite tricarboxylate transporter substrate binding protein [Pseudomonadota bacterium]
MQERSSSIARGAVLCSLCAMLGTGSARSEDLYPSKPVTIVVPQSAGSQADLLVRVLAEQLGSSLHQHFIVNNREGAAGTIGVAAVKQARPDGYTLGYGAQGAFTIQPNLRKSMPYDVNDFEFICQSNTITLVVAVGPQSPFKSLSELIEAARKSPGTITLGSVGIGSGPHLVGESIALEAGVKFNHIPFKSIGDLNTQLIAGSIDFTVTTPTLLVTFQKRNVRALA